MADQTSDGAKLWEDLGAYIQTLGKNGPGCCVIQRGPITARISNVGDLATCQEVAKNFHAAILSYTPGHDC